LDNTSSKIKSAEDKDSANIDSKEALTESSKDTSKEDTTRLKIRNTCFQLEQALADFEKDNSPPSRDLQEKIRIKQLQVQLAALREQIENLS
jgi:hypothetical protein